MPFCSNLRITHGSTVLLDYDDKIDAPPSISGEVAVQVTPFLRANTVGVFDRGNQSHTIEWTASERVTNVYNSAVNVLSHANAVPRGKADVVIQLSNTNTSFRLTDAVVQTWQSTWDEKRESLTISIVGGQWIDSISEYDASTTTITADSTVLTADIQ